MTAFPKIKNLKWVSDKFPDLIIVKIELENRKQAELGIPGYEPETVLEDQYLDLSLLAGVRNWWPNDAEEPSKTECLADFNGVPQSVLAITREQLLEAWLFYKTYKYDSGNI